MQTLVRDWAGLPGCRRGGEPERPKWGLGAGGGLFSAPGWTEGREDCNEPAGPGPGALLAAPAPPGLPALPCTLPAPHLAPQRCGRCPRCTIEACPPRARGPPGNLPGSRAPGRAGHRFGEEPGPAAFAFGPVGSRESPQGDMHPGVCVGGFFFGGGTRWQLSPSGDKQKGIWGDAINRMRKGDLEGELGYWYPTSARLQGPPTPGWVACWGAEEGTLHPLEYAWHSGTFPSLV